MPEEYLKSRMNVSTLNKEQRLHLIYGTTTTDDSHCPYFKRHELSEFPFESEAPRRQLWEENKDRLIAEIWEKSFYDNGFYYFENRFIGETPFPDAFHEYEKGCARCSRRALESSTP
jgi:hypothetical protein